MEWIDPAGFGLRIDFEFRQDRWTHRICCLSTGRPKRLLLASIEGTASDRWPPSPPLQDLVIERLADPWGARNAPQAAGNRLVAMLLGRAGSGHWSASLELLPDPVRLVVDLACRSAKPPEFIGSSYELSSTATDPTAPGDRLALWRDSGAIISLTQVAGSFHLSPSKPWSVCICPEALDPPATWRWCYAIAIERAVA